MMKPVMKTLSSRAVGKLEVRKDTVFWDKELTGFGVRVYPTGSKVYIAQARGPEGPKRVAVGRHGVIHAEEACKRAALIIARVKAGEEAAPEPMKPTGGPSVAEVAARYLTEYVEVRCKPRTAAAYRSVLEKHIAPARASCRSRRSSARRWRSFIKGCTRRLRSRTWRSAPCPRCTAWPASGASFPRDYQTPAAPS